MKVPTEIVMAKIGSGFKQRWESEVIRRNAVGYSHKGEKVE
jgi:hypothetical protein